MLQKKIEQITKIDFTFVNLLKHCTRRKDLCKGVEIHADVVKHGLLERSPYVASTLINMYAKCDAVRKAQKVLDELCVRDIFSWSALIAGYVQQGKGHEALRCFEQIRREGLFPNAVTLSCVLKACSSTRDLPKGKQIHEEIVTRGLLEKNIVLGNALIDIYVKSGMFDQAKQVLDELPIRNVVSWSALIAGYAQHGKGCEALKCFDEMQREGIQPNVVTFTCVLKACGSTGSIDKSKQIHDEIISKGLLEKDVVLGNALVDMYVKFGMFSKAQEVLDQLPIRNVSSWNTIIAGYAEQSQGHAALTCFESMQEEGLIPDEITFICILKACGSTGSIEIGKCIHREIFRKGLINKNITLSTALVDMYAKCGMVAKAQEVFDQLPVRNVVTWSALITGYVQEGHWNEALKCFESMQNDGLTPDEVTFTCILKACGNIGAINIGQKIHDEVVSKGLEETNIVIGTALVDMYAKCGFLSKAKHLLYELPLRNTVSWSALIAGYAGQGQAHEALKCIEHMHREGLCPNAVTILCILNACNHTGLINEAETYFGDLSRGYSLMLSLEQHTCMVGAFGYAGHFDKAIAVIEKMPCSDHPQVWLAMLSACRKWGNVELGRLAFDQVMKLDIKSTVQYILMANIYAAAGMNEDAEKVEVMRIKPTRKSKP